jgi:GH15 family glucan-1,4-alpha-glucosidase
MSTALVLSNHEYLVNIDTNLQISDLYFPHIGQENHLASRSNIMFVRIDGEIFEINPNNFEININYSSESLVGKSTIVHYKTGLSIEFDDFILPDLRVFIRDFTIINNDEHPHEVYVYFQNNFTIYENDIADTVLWYQKAGAIIHYKKNRYVGVGSTNRIYQFSCAGTNDNNHKGAYPNTNGQLHFNSISNGSVNSCISYRFKLDPSQKQNSNYFIIGAFSFEEIERISNLLRSKPISRFLEDTNKYWKKWIENLNISSKFVENSEQNSKLMNLYKRSLMIINSHIDTNGAILASTDGKYIKNGGKDSYAYFWPRDGAYVALALIETGQKDQAKKYIEYISKLISEEGYFLHKYYPNIDNFNWGLASSWHPWIDNTGKSHLPIQEDATALNLYVIWKYYEKFRDFEFLNNLWDKLIFPMANFLGNYRFTLDYDVETIRDYVSGFEVDEHDDFNNKLVHSKLPRPSYDLWEERRSINTFTCSTVFAALKSASQIAIQLGKIQYSKAFENFANEVKEATIKYFYSDDIQRFKSGIVQNKKGKCEDDNTVDASMYAIWHFGMLNKNDEKVENTMNAIVEHLTLSTPIGGIARRENDHYLRKSDDVIGNPWFICTLWVAQYYLELGEKEKAMEYINWIVEHADTTNLLAEQANPYTGFGESVKPLIWSHSEYVRTLNILARING